MNLTSRFHEIKVFLAGEAEKYIPAENHVILQMYATLCHSDKRIIPLGCYKKKNDDQFTFNFALQDIIDPVFGKYTVFQDAVYYSSDYLCNASNMQLQADLQMLMNRLMERIKYEYKEGSYVE